jgi:2-iminobutanoate/2-iminopropanoate deaminase
MSVERVWPADVYKRSFPGFDQPAYTQVTVSSGAKRTVAIAGTFPCDPDFNLIGGDSMQLQVRAVLENIKRSIEAVGGTTADIIRTKTYVTDIAAYVREGHAEWLSFFGDKTPASTAVQVVALADDRCLIEIEAYAELDT